MRLPNAAWPCQNPKSSSRLVLCHWQSGTNSYISVLQQTQLWRSSDLTKNGDARRESRPEQCLPQVNRATAT
jgi:hypothetical protein